MAADNDSSSDSDKSPFTVLGVALIVDQIGHGARMAFRYPTAPPIGDKVSEDLFFRLAPRQMAKLFRPKPPLCGQPMTLSVGGTVFCCCATLIAEESSSGSGEAVTAEHAKNTTANTSSAASASPWEPSDAHSHSHLSLFSVVVALAPRVRASTIPITAWIDSDEDVHPHLRPVQEALSEIQGKLGMPGSNDSRASPSFLCIRRVHVSLARLCRILEREERRCQYISLQCQLFKHVRLDVIKRRKHGGGGQENTTSKQHRQQLSSSTPPVPSATSPISVVSKSINTNSGQQQLQLQSQALPTAAVSQQQQHQSSTSSATIERPTRLHARAASWTLEREVNERQPLPDTENLSPTKSDPADEEQEILETILSISPVDAAAADSLGSTDDYRSGEQGMWDTDDSSNSLFASTEIEVSQLYERGHQGNLARELVAVYHSMARDSEHPVAQSPADVLGGQGSIVYVNRHIAVAIESVGVTMSDPAVKIRLRPYHTLLFPHASPTELLTSLSASGTAVPRRLQQLLSMANPQKSLKDIATDANLPLPVATDLAMYLISQGACLASPLLTRSSILCCPSVEGIHENALTFAQTFGPKINLFILVSFLTCGRSLGEVMSLLANSTEENVDILREQLESSLLPLSSHVITPDQSKYLGDKNLVSGSSESGRIEQMEELLYSMAVWLRSHMIVKHVLEFLVQVRPSEPDKATNSVENGEKKTETSQHGNERLSDDALFQELLDSGCLNGTMSLQTCSWRIGMDKQKLKAFALRHESIRLVARASMSGDDW